MDYLLLINFYFPNVKGINILCIGIKGEALVVKLGEEHWKPQIWVFE